MAYMRNDMGRPNPPMPPRPPKPRGGSAQDRKEREVQQMSQTQGQSGDDVRMRMQERQMNERRMDMPESLGRMMMQPRPEQPTSRIMQMFPGAQLLPFIQGPVPDEIPPGLRPDNYSGYYDMQMQDPRYMLDTQPRLVAMMRQMGM